MNKQILLINPNDRSVPLVAEESTHGVWRAVVHPHVFQCLPPPQCLIIRIPSPTESQQTFSPAPSPISPDNGFWIVSETRKDETFPTKSTTLASWTMREIADHSPTFDPFTRLTTSLQLQIDIDRRLCLRFQDAWIIGDSHVHNHFQTLTHGNIERANANIFLKCRN